MKTPRDLLLERHRAAVPQLDNVRARVLAGASRPARFTRQDLDETRPGLVLFLELIFPYRKAWLGLAAVWVLILTARIAGPFPPTPDTSGATTAPPHAVAMAFDRYRAEVRELIGPSAPPPVKAQPASRPKPRGELRSDHRPC